MSERPFLSFTTIVKNESRCIVRCLDSVAPFVDEFIIVDTGSTDNTLELIHEFSLQHITKPVKVINYEWNDDFASARNAGVDQCSGRYIFSLDADEYISQEDFYELKQTIKFLKRSKDPHTVTFRVMSIIDNKIGEVEGIKLVKLFPNHDDIRYSRRIHETLDKSLSSFKHREYSIDVRIFTDGYSSSVDQLSKRQRNLRILNMMIQEDSNDYISMVYFARDLYVIYPDKSIELLKRVLPTIPHNDTFWKELCTYYLNLFTEDIKKRRA